MLNRITNDKTDTRPDKEPGWLESMLTEPLTPYFLGATTWILAWYLQMGPLRPWLNFAPGVELPFFPAGVRTLAVFTFGFAGAIGIFIGSVVTYALYFPELMTASPLGVIGCAAASAFSSYLAMRIICHLCQIPPSLTGLSMSNVGWIVVTQALISATLHQSIYHLEVISTVYDTPELNTALFNWAAMASGDALGSMSVLLVILLVFHGYSQYANRRQQP